MLITAAGTKHLLRIRPCISHLASCSLDGGAEQYGRQLSMVLNLLGQHQGHLSPGCQNTTSPSGSPQINHPCHALLVSAKRFTPEGEDLG